ncbi:MAG: DUF6020 family protein, partial [Planctomycetota bacterium]
MTGPTANQWVGLSLLGAWLGLSVGITWLYDAAPLPRAILSIALVAAGALTCRVLLPYSARALQAWSPRGRKLWVVCCLLAGAVLVLAIPLPIPNVPRSGWQAIRAAAAAGGSVGIGLLLLAGGLALARRCPTSRPAASAPRFGWPYALCMAVIWILTLLAFWPGLISPDSVEQWRQFIRWDLDDSHPAFHTLTYWLITRAWLSPAAPALVQVLLLALTAGWGVARMQAHGLSPRLAWLVTVAFALSPVNNALVVTLWKDVLFTVAVLAFTLCILEIVATNGAWLQRRGSPLALGLIAAAVILYRHNGLPVAFGSLLLLLAVYWRMWRRLVLSLGLTAAVWLAVCGSPSIGTHWSLFRAAHVKPPPLPGWLGLVLHHTAAHVHADTPLLDSERALLDALRPCGEWPYDPYCVNWLVYDERLRSDRLSQRRHEVAALAWKLDRRRPLVALRHLWNSSKLVWRIAHPQDSWISLSLGYFDGTRVVTVTDMPAAAEFGLVADPQLPALGRRLAGWISASQHPDNLWFWWRPALYLYVAVAGALIAAARARDARYVLVIAPLVMNSLMIAVLAPAQDFRYQYPAYVVGLLLGPFLLWAAPRPATVSSA